jgi:hypothetical protein
MKPVEVEEFVFEHDLVDDLLRAADHECAVRGCHGAKCRAGDVDAATVGNAGAVVRVEGGVRCLRGGPDMEVAYDADA